MLANGDVVRAVLASSIRPSTRLPIVLRHHGDDPEKGSALNGGSGS